MGQKLPPTRNCGAKEKMIRRLRKGKAEASESAAKRCANYSVSNREGWRSHDRAINQEHPVI